MKKACTLALTFLGVSGLLMSQTVPVYAKREHSSASKKNKVSANAVKPASHAGNALPVNGERVALVIGNTKPLWIIR